MINNVGKFDIEYIALEEKYEINAEVFSKSLISDTRVNELEGLYKVELPSALAVRGDSILDMIVMIYSERINSNVIETKRSLHDIMVDYCGNERLAFLMKKLGFYQVIDIGSNLSSLNDQTAATCFEALIYNIYRSYDLPRVEQFLEKINFYSLETAKSEIISNEEMKLYIQEKIEDIKKIKSDDRHIESEQYRHLISVFEETIQSIIKYHGYNEKDFKLIMNYLSTKYAVNKIDNKGQKKFLSKFTHLIKRIDNLLKDIEEINKNDKRLILKEGTVFVEKEYFDSYRERYIIGFLEEISNSL